MTFFVSIYAWMNFLIFARNESNTIFFSTHTEYDVANNIKRKRKTIVAMGCKFLVWEYYKIFIEKELVCVICLHNLLTLAVYFVLLKSWKLYLQYSKQFRFSTFVICGFAQRILFEL